MADTASESEGCFLGNRCGIQYPGDHQVQFLAAGAPEQGGHLRLPEHGGATGPGRDPEPNHYDQRRFRTGYPELDFQTKAVDGYQSPIAFVGFANILQT